MILQKAQELGIEISESVEFKRMLAARAALDADDTVSAMIEEYNRKQSSIVEMLESEAPNTDAVSGVSDELERLQGDLMAHPLFVEMMEAQNEFQRLMKSVNHAISVCIGMEDGEEEHSECTGSCATCGGCKH